MAKKNQTTAYCHSCGAVLDDDNCRRVPNEFSLSGFSPYCIECESRIYNHLSQSQGKYHALLTACGAFNAPLKPLLLDGVNLDETDDVWLTYVNLLAENGQDVKNGKVLGFADGATTLWSLFGNKLGESDFEKRIALEKEKIKKQVGTEAQRERWGTQPLYKGLPITQSLYDELDRLYDIRANSYKGQTITPQMDDTLIKVAKSNVIYDHLMRSGLVKMALDVQKNIDLLLASEQMRKKDEKPVDSFRPDAWIDAFEKSGIMKDNQFLPFQEVSEKLIDIMRGQGYAQTLDCAHQFEMNVLNNARKNSNQQSIYELPEDMKITDELGEFSAVEGEDEKSARKYAHLTKVHFEKSESEE